MSVDRERLDRLAEDEDYPSVQGSIAPEEYALDHAYAAVDEQITDDRLHEKLTMIPAQYLRGKPDKQEAKWILQDIDRVGGHDEQVADAVDEALEHLGLN